MQMDRFRNMLRTLRSIDAHELPREAFPHPDDRSAFVRDPFGAFIRADQDRAQAIYDVILSRQTWTDSEAPVAELRDLLEGMIDGDAPANDSTVTHALRLLDDIERAGVEEKRAKQRERAAEITAEMASERDL